MNVPLDTNKHGKQSLGADIIAIAKECGWKYQNTIIWNESNISRRTAWGSWLQASAPYAIAPVELIVVFYKNEYKRQKQTSTISKEEFLLYTNGLWSFSGESKKRLNTQPHSQGNYPSVASNCFLSWKTRFLILSADLARLF